MASKNDGGGGGRRVIFLPDSFTCPVFLKGKLDVIEFQRGTDASHTLDTNPHFEGQQFESARRRSDFRTSSDMLPVIHNAIIEKYVNNLPQWTNLFKRKQNTSVRRTRRVTLGAAGRAVAVGATTARSAHSKLSPVLQSFDFVADLLSHAF